MGRKPGVQSVPKEEAQAKVLSLLEQGATITAAMAAVGRQDTAFRQWSMVDESFKEKADKARLAGKGIKADLSELKDMSYPDFSQQFLDTTLFDHQLNWVDLLDGKEPRWQPSGMTYEPGDPKRILINVPPEHAKSTTITTNYTLYTIVTNPNARVIIVSKTQGMARKFLGAIKTRLSHPAYMKLQTAFGPNGGYKADATQWSADMIYLGTGRDSGEKDPTVQALGFGSQIYGARADLIILDDVVMNSNAHEWEKQIEWLQKEVITRLGRHGKLLIVGTRVAPVDLYKMIRDGAQWTGGKTPFTYCAMPAVLEFDENPQNWKTLWPKTNIQENDLDDQFEDGLYPKWDGPSLFKRRSEVAPSIWAMVYQQEDIQEDSIFSPTCVAGSVNGMRKRGPLKAGVPGHPKNVESYTVIGLDPAMSGATGAVVVSYNRGDGRIYILDCINMIEPTPAKIQNLIEDWVERYKPQELRIEINAHQKAYALDDVLRNYLASHGCQLNSHFTGKNKWDVSFGVASMASLFGNTRDGRFQDNNLMELPSNEGSEGLKTLVQQLITWRPNTKNPTDCVMALWFAVIRVRELMNRSSKVGQFAQNRWATQSQINQRQSINLDEAFADQWSDQYS
jgi:Terminase RNaseH-like domain